MAVYRFKVCLEENEDIFRDIEIQASQNFEHFHTIIQEAFKFDSKHASSFFVSDDYWRKGQEITLRKEDLPLEEEEIRKKVDPKKLMGECRIAKFIDQPHQRFVYVFDPKAQWTFLIEMIKIAEENPRSSYPLLVKSQGTAPKQYKPTNIPGGSIASESGLAGLLTELEEEDEIIYKLAGEEEEGIEDEDIDSLEGEEIDEEVANEEEGSDDFGVNDEIEEG
jgi:hypothetical protein